MPAELENVGVTEHLDGQLPLGATFIDSTGHAVELGRFFGGSRPAILVLAYYTCPVLCGMVLHATADGLRGTDWTAGKEFEVIVVSIDPRDTPEKAAAKQAEVQKHYARLDGMNGFHFLVGKQAAIDSVAQAVGFQYKYDERQGQYAHPAVLTLVKPNGRVARYIYGLEYPPQDLRLGLLEAADYKTVTTLERVLLYCYHYDPQDRKYVLLATRVMKLGGAATVVVLGSFLVLMWLSERRRGKPQTPSSGQTPPVPPAGSVGAELRSS